MMESNLPDTTRPGDEAHESSRTTSDLAFGAGVSNSSKLKTSKKKSAKKSPRKPASGRRKKAPAKATKNQASESGLQPKDGKPKRKRSRKKSSKSSGEERPKAVAAPEQSEGTESPKRSRRRGSRGGRRRKSKSAAVVDAIPGEEDDLPELPQDAELLREGKSKKKPRKRSSRKKAAGVSGEDTSESKRAAKPKEKKAAVVERTQRILVNAIDREEKRVAVVEGERIVDFLMTSESQKTLVSDIYRGKIVNLEPAIGAAFVDFGQGRNGFLHTSDVLPIYGEKGFTLDQLLTAQVDPDEWNEDGEEIDEAGDDEGGEPEKGRKKRSKSSARKRPSGRSRRSVPISDLVRVGDQVVVQITKDAIGDKGPTLTTYISIPGRYLVLMPSMARTGVSRKIPDDKERRRLKRILTQVGAPPDMGVIVRTAGVGQTKTELKRDLDYLLGVWESFGKRLKSGRGPLPLYQESDVAVRTLRDLFGARTEAVVVDDPMVEEELKEFAEKLMPEDVDRIETHDGERPIFNHYGIEQDFEKIFSRRVELPSGGSIVFDQTEALVAIDVNSGRTRTGGFDFEEIALKTNLEAVPEIARQIRLRDLGGIIVCDFIDMMRSSSLRTVERALRSELADDRARSKLGRISQFGLLEMTRQRLGPGTHKKVFQACPRCRGTGRIRTVQSRAAAILRRLGTALTQKGFSAVEVRAHPEVVDYLREDLFDYVRALEHRFEKDLELIPVENQPEDSVLRYLRADGREVRPGGRRKKR